MTAGGSGLRRGSCRRIFIPPFCFAKGWGTRQLPVVSWNTNSHPFAPQKDGAPASEQTSRSFDSARSGGSGRDDKLWELDRPTLSQKKGKDGAPARSAALPPVGIRTPTLSPTTGERMGHPRLHDALQGRGVRCWLRADWNVCGETKTLSSDTKTPTPPKEGGMGHPAMTSTNRWTAGFGCEKQLSVAGCQLSVRFFPRFRQRRAKGWGNCQRTRTDERTRAEGAGGDSAEPGWVSAGRGVRVESVRPF